MKPIQIISQDLFDKVRSRFQNLEMGDETGAVTLDPAEARFFDFDFIYEGTNLGRISVSLNDLGSLKIYYSQGITENKDDVSKKLWYDFLKEMRLFAMRRLLRFDTRDITKTNLDKNDFQYLASKAPKEENTMNMNESRWMLEKSSKKTSRAVRGRTQVIVRHTESMAEKRLGERSNPRRIKAIYIENSDGERFKYPFIHPAGAFAMAQHVDHGGIPHDPAGKAIIKMSEQIAQLQSFQRQVQKQQLHDDAMGITERAISKLHELKSTIEALGKRHHYESWVETFEEQDDPLMADLDPVTMEDYKSKFTQVDFKEELANYFPLIHSIMQETNTIDLEDYVKEETCPKCHCDPCECDDEENVKENAFDAFAEWAEAVEQGKLTDDQIAELKSALEVLPDGKLELGPDGQTAWQFFSSYGLEDSDLENKLKMAAELDQATNPIEVFQVWAKDNYPELLVALGLSNSEAEPAAEPEAEPAAAPAPEEPEQPVAEGKNSWIQEVAKLVKSRYNAANESVGPFNGYENIALDVKKEIGEKFGEELGEKAEMVAKKFMEKLTNEWEERHGRPATQSVDQDDGLAKLKELLDRVKVKVETIDPKNPRDYEKPAYMRKQDGQSPLTMKDIDDKDNASPTSSAGLAKRKAELGITENVSDILKLAGLAK